jgi:methylase of polypeptide subunit release factors
MARFHEAFAGGDGCVYTERGDVRFMARRALAEHLAASHPEGAALPRDKAFRLVGASPGTIAGQAARLTASERRAARARLRALRALDPACGAGAFLVGLLEEIVRLGRALGTASPEGAAARVVSENLFGVDVDPHAVAVTRRRLAAAVSGAHPALAVGDALRLDWPRVFPSLAQFPTGGHGTRGAAQAGFDLVIGNPPYLRQERIDRQGRLGPGTKRATWEAARRRWGRDLGISKRADLYVYFFLEALRLLRPGGGLVFLTSHAWLDLDYGAALRAFLLEEADLPLILESDHRAFRRASVNTIVTVALRRPNGASPPGAGWPPRGRLSTSRQGPGSPGDPRPHSPVCFARLHRSLARASEGPLFIALDGQRDREDAALRMRRASPRDLAPAAPAHAAPRWGGLWLRGPAVIFRARERSAGRTVPLGEIAEVVFGLKTGCNAFFYLDDAGPVPGALRRCRSRLDGGHHLIEARFLSPIVTTLKEVDGLSVAPDGLHRRLLTIPPGADLEGTHAAAYLRVGERHGVHRRASLASRRSWFSLAPPRGAFLIPRRVGERMPVARALGVPFDNNLFGRC